MQLCPVLGYRRAELERTVRTSRKAGGSTFLLYDHTFLMGIQGATAMQTVPAVVSTR